MDINLVKEKLNQVLKTPEDDKKYQSYISAYTKLLDEMKINSDTVNLAIESVDIDQGVNFLDAFAALEKKQVQSAWKTIRQCKEYKNNTEFRTLKLMCSFTASALSGDENTAIILGNILTAVASFVKKVKQEEDFIKVYEILKKYILEMLSKDVKLPEWKSIKITPENIMIFCEVMSKVLELPEVESEKEIYPAAFAVKRWISQGSRFAGEAMELKKEKNDKLPKKSAELMELANHFKQLEDKFDKSIHELSMISLEKKKLQEDLQRLEADKRNLEKEIKRFEVEKEELVLRISQAEQEVNDRKKLNDVQVRYREEAQISLLQDIARALKAEYEDYEETQNIPMNKMLGEIYREKLKQIFKILEQKGVRVRYE